MVYLDTSVIVAALTLEPHSERVLHWMERQDEGVLFVSDWTNSEVSSALALKVRTGALSIAKRAEALATWHDLLRHTVKVIPIDSGQFATAAVFADRYELGLRAGDALHLAIVADAGVRIATLDKTMAAAAPILGIPVEPI